MTNQERGPVRLVDDSPRQLALGLVFGVIFGFLLQKGGVAKYDILVGVLLLEDFTVVKVMLSAVVVGMIGIHGMRSLGLVELHIKPTQYAANIAGGLIFGVGFAMAGYCPGTGAAAFGQGNLDALAVIAGLVLGSLFYAEVSDWIDRRLGDKGSRGEMTIPELLHVRKRRFIALFSLVLASALVLLGSHTGW